jgi:hypothetical protein
MIREFSAGKWYGFWRVEEGNVAILKLEHLVDDSGHECETEGPITAPRPPHASSSLVGMYANSCCPIVSSRGDVKRAPADAM